MSRYRKRKHIVTADQLKSYDEILIERRRVLALVEEFKLKIQL